MLDTKSHGRHPQKPLILAHRLPEENPKLVSLRGSPEKTSADLTWHPLALIFSNMTMRPCCLASLVVSRTYISDHVTIDRAGKQTSMDLDRSSWSRVGSLMGLRNRLWGMRTSLNGTQIVYQLLQVDDVFSSDRLFHFPWQTNRTIHFVTSSCLAVAKQSTQSLLVKEEGRSLCCMG